MLNINVAGESNSTRYRKILFLNFLIHFINKMKKIIFAILNTTEKKVTGFIEKFLKRYIAT
tara:strand:- start:417 stop:599 length:183 start_codon:yes stop_codon:yes gene_type:complete